MVEEPGEGRVPRVNQQPETVVLNEIAAAGLLYGRPGSATAKNGESHAATLLSHP